MGPWYNTRAAGRGAVSAFAWALLADPRTAVDRPVVASGVLLPGFFDGAPAGAPAGAFDYPLAPMPARFNGRVVRNYQGEWFLLPTVRGKTQEQIKLGTKRPRAKRSKGMRVVA